MLAKGKKMNLLKTQFGGLSPIFWILLFSCCAMLCIGNFITAGGTLGLIAGLSGVIYAFFAGQGRVICFAFGFVYNITYALIAYEFRLMGEVILNLCFYVPIGVYGVYAWLRNQNKIKQSIVIRRLSFSLKIFYICLVVVLSLLGVKFLTWLDSSFIYAESFIFIALVIAFVLQVLRYTESYALVTLANVTSIIVWFLIFQTSPQSIVQLLTTTIFLCIGVHYWRVWWKESQ